MYDMKTSQFAKNINQHQQQQQDEIIQKQNKHKQINITNILTTSSKTANSADILNPHLTSGYSSSCSIIKLPLCPATDSELYNNPADSTHMTLMTLRRRRWLLQRHACLFSILLAFILGMALGVFLPMFGWAHMWQSLNNATPMEGMPQSFPIMDMLNADATLQMQYRTNRSTHTLDKTVKSRPPSDFPTIYELRREDQAENPFSVAFIQETVSENSKIYTADTFGSAIKPRSQLNFLPLNAKSNKRTTVNAPRSNLIKSDIYWGDEVERLLPLGFTPQDSHTWNEYLRKEARVERLEEGCGRMQNRLVIFADGRRACARYRQNTDQIQGELFSFYLGQLLNLSNLVPSAAGVIDLDATTWRGVSADITQAQWKQQRPVVLTQWLPELEPAGIPKPFQVMESHLNKYDVWNMTIINSTKESARLRGAEINQLNPLPSESEFIKRLGIERSKRVGDNQSLELAENAAAKLLKQRLIELAQWSDLILFDYLIANLDRVVNNLYNYQWNADIMSASAHNLARLKQSQLLVFLDNESGLLHGYRLLKKYEPFHALLLDNLCVFRQPTIEALKQLRIQGVGRRLREMFESTTTNNVRDVLPSLPDKSIKILVDRIDRVLGQVQQCKELLADR